MKAVALLLSAFAVVPASAEKTDRIALSNGTEVIGEIKSLGRGELRVSTDYMRTVQLDWVQVLWLESELEFEVQAIDGERYFGMLVRSEEDRVLVVEGDDGAIRLPYDQVLLFDQTRSEELLGKIALSISAGFSFTQATDTTQISFDGSGSRRTRRFLSRFGLVAILSDTREEDFTRADLNYSIMRHLPGRWTWESSLSVQSNDKIGLDRRYLLRETAQLRTVRSSIRELWLGIGLALSREEFTADEPGDDSAEGTLSLRYDAFHFDDPELQVSTELLFFKSLTVSGRERIELTADVRRELVSDLFWLLSLYGSYDSKPVGDAEMEDIAVVASLGWKF